MGKALAWQRSREIGDAWNQLANLLTVLEKARSATQPAQPAHLAQAVRAHIQDLRACLPTLREHKLSDTAAEVEKAANELEAAAQPAPVTLISSEQHIALREAFAINSADLYFEANPTHDNDVGRMLFERGFARGFDSHERAIETAKKGNT
jgi:DNA repair exonuclease SbcCD ATPase subunit